MSGFTAVGYFLLSMFFSIVNILLWARFGLRYFRVSSLHPAAQTIITFTTPMIKPLERLFKSSNTRVHRYDWACLSMIIIVDILKFTLLGVLFLGQFPTWIILPVYVLADLIIAPCNLLFYSILIRVIMSWVNPGWRNPLAEIIYLITEPLLYWARRKVPPISGLDFSPFIIMIGLKVVTLFTSASVASPFM